MTRNVVITPEAKADVERLVRFLSERAPEAALQANHTIRQALDSLETRPERGRTARIENYRELVIRFGRGSYIARYRIEGADVLVTRIHHSREDRA